MATKTATKAKATKYVAKTSEEKAEQIKAMHDTIANAVANITTSEEWAAYLKFGARFYRYSFNNMMLIYINASHRGMTAPTRVASFGAWAKLEHPVRKGEKGLPIFAPIIASSGDDTAGATAAGGSGCCRQPATMHASSAAASGRERKWNAIMVFLARVARRLPAHSGSGR